MSSNMKYQIRTSQVLFFAFTMDRPSNIDIETALNALQNLRREHLGASSTTSVTSPREGVASELRRAFPTLRREAGQRASGSWRDNRPRTSSSRKRQAASSRSSTTTKPVYKDLILIPNPSTDKVPMHNNRIKLEKRGFVVHEFPFEKHWNDSYLEEKILHAFKDKGLMAFEYVKVSANC